MMITISWNNWYQRNYPKHFLTNNSDYFNSMLNDIYLDNNLSIINIQLPDYIKLDNGIIDNITSILNNLDIDNLELNYLEILSIIYILSYIQFQQIRVVLEKLKEWQKARPDNKDLNNLITKYLDITFYIVRLQQDAMAKDMMISKYRFERNKARLELQELKDKYTHLKELEL